MIVALSKQKFFDDIRQHEQIISNMIETAPTFDDFIGNMLTMYDNLQLDEYQMMVLSTTLNQPKYDMLKIELALAANTSHMVNLCKLGFGRLFDDLQYVKSEAMNLVKPQDHDFRYIFSSVWDLHSVSRSLVPFIYHLDPTEFSNSCDKLYDFQLGIYNRCLDATYKIKRLGTDYFTDREDVLVNKILTCLYEDAIGSETRGVETFFNNFVKYMTTNQWHFDGAQAYDDFVSILDMLCIEIMNDFETIFSHSPVRIAIYMRFKIFRYRVNPHYDEEFYKLEGGRLNG